MMKSKYLNAWNAEIFGGIQFKYIQCLCNIHIHISDRMRMRKRERERAINNENIFFRIIASDIPDTIIKLYEMT